MSAKPNVKVNNFQVKRVTVTLALDTNAYGDLDLLADTVEVDLGLEAHQQNRIVRVELTGLTVLDKADQKQALDVLFLSEAQTLGTLNSAPTVSDTNAEKVLRKVSVGAGDYLDLGGAAFADPEFVPKSLEARAGKLYVAAISRGTGTYGAASLILGLELRVCNAMVD